MKKLMMITCCCIAMFTACDKIKLDQLPSWNSDWILPIVKATLKFDDIKQFTQKTISFEIPAIDLGYAAGATVNVPATTFGQIGPYKQSFNTLIKAIYFDSLEINMALKNIFPIAIGAGTHISFRRAPNTADPNNLIYEHIVPSDILPNQDYNFNIVVNNNFIADTVYMYLEQFSTPGGNNVVFNSSPTTLNVTLSVIDVQKVELYANQTETIEDTVGVAINDSLNHTISDTSYTAKVNFYVENALPMNQQFQLYFLSATNNTIIDSLFTSPFNTAGCSSDVNGTPSNIKSDSTSVFIDNERVKKIQGCNKAVIHFTFDTNGYAPPFVTANDSSYFSIQLTGDLHISFNLHNL